MIKQVILDRFKSPLRISAVLLSVISHVISIILFSLYYRNLEIGYYFLWQFYAFAIVSVVLSLMLFFIYETSTQIIFIFLRYLLLFLIGYPLGNYIGIELILYASLIIEISFYLSFPGNIIVQSIIFFLFMLSQGEVSAWQKNIERVSIHDLTATAVYSLIIIVISLMLNKYSKNCTEKTKKIEHLDSAITQLTDANIGFQSYVKTLEIQTLIEERKRVSREIHDTVGYVLTNIIMMMEAAALLTDEKKIKRNEILSTARDQAQKGLSETRTALRHLRNEKIVKAYGINMIEELVSVFQQATGIDIKVEYGNLSGFTNDRIDAIIFRTIQEGMTNAFRHGMATVIRINFWITQKSLRVTIHDNGIGSKEIVDGIGVAGMRERITDIGGNIDIRNVDDGFKIDVEIPLE
ncbi:MAG: sensor histidine kinase [Spirochaetia bacterium]|nr:sensor histidine kinase [Spirochaetia bacterium]